MQKGDEKEEVIWGGTNPTRTGEQLLRASERGERHQIPAEGGRGGRFHSQSRELNCTYELYNEPFSLSPELSL